MWIDVQEDRRSVQSRLPPPRTHLTGYPLYNIRFSQDQAGVLTLCGCQRGGRLTSDEMKTVQRVTCGMAGASARLETLFETLAPKIRVSNFLFTS